MPELPVTEGTITVKGTGISSAPGVQLSGPGGNGWSLDQQNELHLTPQGSPTQYHFTLVRDQSELSFTLKGVRFFLSSSPNAKVLILSPSGEQVVFDLIDDIPHDGTTFSCQISIGITINNVTTWHDPTIAFEPEQG